LANNLAWLLLEQNTDVDKALELAQSAYKRLPEDPCVADTLGWAYYKKGRLEWAEIYLKEAVSKNPNNPLANFHLGMLSFLKEDKATTVDILKRALALHLENPYQQEAKQIVQELQKKNHF
jgi:Flp pilus assembly protein TadD